MKLTELVEPEYSKNDAPDFNYISGLIEDHCSIALQFFRQTKLSLYRGISSEKPFLQLAPPEDRGPLHSASFLHDAAVSKLDKAGFTANRNNSFFCSGLKSQTIMYGSTFRVFPYNNFYYTWSPMIRDFMSDWDAPVPRDIRRIGQTVKWFTELPEKEFEKIYEYRAGNNRTLDDFEKAIKSGNEILIHSSCIMVSEKFYGNDLTNFLAKKY